LHSSGNIVPIWRALHGSKVDLNFFWQGTYPMARGRLSSPLKKDPSSSLGAQGCFGCAGIMPWGWRAQRFIAYLSMIFLSFSFRLPA
jgi:hypothetical protein